MEETRQVYHPVYLPHRICFIENKVYGYLRSRHSHLRTSKDKEIAQNIEDLVKHHPQDINLEITPLKDKKIYLAYLKKEPKKETPPG